eukprot:jgi/Mesvir1/7933/Mv11855-RA.1
MRAVLYLTVVVLATCSLFHECCATFRDGDSVPMARRGQYHGTRTHWHDALGRHCPKFNVDTMVALPIPKPVGFQEEDVYKLSLAFAGDRYLLPWMLIFGPGVDKLPHIHVDMVHSAGELRAVRSTVTPVSDHYAALHVDLEEQYRNATHWPKHVLVSYRWVQASEVDLNTGLYVLFGAGLLASLFLMYVIVHGSKDKFSKFVSDAVTEASEEVKQD